ncbi:MAG TPA: M48 family metalloprotease [Candidatus Acidoferrales bacterium]|nr:M48 family metalloprotease [Candidatus Acidoferrales bacterium]
MRLRAPFIIFVLLVSFCASAPPLIAQQGCPAPNFRPSPKEKIIFNEQQEMDLGDAVAEHVQRSYRVIDDTIADNVQRIGDRLVSHLPAGDMKYRFLLVDIPEANAYTLAGGRVYVTRKLVAATKSEDELAGVLSHELGHNLMRDLPIRYTYLFDKVLGVTQVGDRKDIFEKYHQLLENIAKKAGSLRIKDREEQESQVDADRVAMYLAAQSGYAPQAVPQFWDRLAETKGKTGSAFANLFGFTKPEQVRLREMLRLANALPTSCVGARAAAAPEAYDKWKAAVTAYTGLGHREALRGVLDRKVLNPPLRSDIQHLQFSPNGKYVLAQDDTSVFVLSRQPFEILFRFDAPDAYPAKFSPDSESVVFYNRRLHVERWSVAQETRTGLQEIVIIKNCVDTALSPDGRLLACHALQSDLNSDLTIYAVDSGAEIFQKKNFYNLDGTGFLGYLIYLGALYSEGESSFVRMAFSPDGKYFLAARGDKRICVDVKLSQTISLPSSVERLLGSSFAFLGPDRLVGIAGDKGAKSAVVRFPSGEKIVDLNLGVTSVDGATHGDFVLLRPIEKYALGVLDIARQKIVMANQQAAFDIYDREFVAERRNGELGLYSADKDAALATLSLPRSTLGTLRAKALSPDRRWLAVSQRNRGAVWNLERNERIFHVRGFRGAFIGEDGMLYADFPEYREDKRNIAHVNLATREASPGMMIQEKRATQYGWFIVQTKPAKKDGPIWRDVTVEVSDARSGQWLWTRAFPKETPSMSVSEQDGTMAFFWMVDRDSAKDEIKNDPALKNRFDQLKDKTGAYLVLLVDARTGKPLSKLLVETGKGSFFIASVHTTGDMAVITDTQNRTLVYALSSGEEIAKTFGTGEALAKSTGLLCVSNGRGKLAFYDLRAKKGAAFEPTQKLVFGSPISMAEFSADGKRLFVLTADQTAYLLDMTAVMAANR